MLGLLARGLGVGRTTVTDALKRFANEGLAGSRLAVEWFRRELRLHTGNLESRIMQALGARGERL